MARQKTEIVTEEFCPWPYYQPYVFERKLPPKPPTKPRPKSRSAIAKDLFGPKYRQRVLPNKKKDVKPEASE